MSRLIDADALKSVMIETLEKIKANPKMDNQEAHVIAAFHTVGLMIADAPTVDAVPAKAIEQFKWERDTAIQQLEAHGIPFCGKADVVPVVRCKDCKFYNRCTDNQAVCKNRYVNGFIFPNWFCADGKRKEQNDE